MPSLIRSLTRLAAPQAPRARNAGLLAARILGLSDAALADRVASLRAEQSEAVPLTVED